MIISNPWLSAMDLNAGGGRFEFPQGQHGSERSYFVIPYANAKLSSLLRNGLYGGLYSR